MTTPAGHLLGSASIVNVGEGTFFSYNAEAIACFTDRLLFSASSDLVPTLRQANSADSTSPADAIYNEYLVAAGLDANTDWVVTFPTKSFYVDTYYNPTTAVQPFHELFHAPGVSNVQVARTIYDEEEGLTAGSAGRVSFLLPYQVNVLGFLNAVDVPDNRVSDVFGSTLSANIAPYGNAGWLILDLTSGDGGSHALRAAANGDVLHGLPATGFMVYNIINANAAPGKLANYGGSYSHRATVLCSHPRLGFTTGRMQLKRHWVCTFLHKEDPPIKARCPRALRCRSTPLRHEVAMYKNMSVLIGLALSATLASTPVSALILNPGGVGQVMLYPYYTVNKGQDTLLSVINTSEHGKVAKIRFLEGYNGRSVLEFSVLSPRTMYGRRPSARSPQMAEQIFSCTTQTVFIHMSTNRGTTCAQKRRYAEL